jgi:hypothetical protein
LEFPITVPNSFPTQNFPYVKIHKIDHNNNNNGVALGQATRLRIEFPMLNEYRLIGDIIETIPFPTYYLYKVQKLDFIYFNEANNYIKDYSVSASVTSSYSVGNGTPKTIINWNSSLPGTNLPHYGTPYFNTSSGIFTFENTPNIKLTLTASINTTGNGITSNFIQLIQIRNQTETVLSTSKVIIGQ